jgi:Malectin-like domain
LSPKYSVSAFLKLTHKSLHNNLLIHIGFVNLDCGGIGAHTDDIGLQWTPDSNYMFGKSAKTSFGNDNKKQYSTVRYFLEDAEKYCYDLNVTSNMRYLVRATFFYGSFDNATVYPKFHLSLGATYWDEIVINDVDIPVVKEMIVLAPSDSLSICLFNTSSGVRFISTIELRKFNRSMYYTQFETEYFMFTAARINFGAHSNASVR